MTIALCSANDASHTTRKDIHVCIVHVRVSVHTTLLRTTQCVPLSLDHVVLGLREARLYSSGPLLRCIVHTAMKRLTYNNHTDIQDELRNAPLSYMYTHDCRVYVHVRPERYAAVNPPLRHGREVTRVNEKRGCARLLVSLSLSLYPECTAFSQEMVAKAGLTFDCLHILNGFSEGGWNSSNNTVR